MTNKEKCRELKSIRKKMAEKLGVELNQTECTYEGECRGTCPKCQSEEKKLNRVLLSGAVAATVIALSGCAPEVSGLVEAPTPSVIELDGDVDNPGANKITKEPLMGDVVYVGDPDTGISEPVINDPDPADFELAGDVPNPDSIQPEDTDNNTTDTDGPDIVELEGDVPAPVEEYNYDVEGRISEEDIISACCKYKNAISAGIEYYNGNMADITFCGMPVIEDGNMICKVVDVISVDIFSGDATTSNGEEFSIWDYIEKN